MKIRMGLVSVFAACVVVGCSGGGSGSGGSGGGGGTTPDMGTLTTVDDSDQ